MSMAEYEKIFKPQNGKEFRVSGNKCAIKCRWHDFTLQEGMLYGLRKMTIRGKKPETAVFLWIYAGKKRTFLGVHQVQLWVRNNLNPNSALFDWKKVWFDCNTNFLKGLYAQKVTVKYYEEYRIDYSIPRNNQMSYTPSGGKSVGALFEYGGYNKGRMKK